MKAGLRGPTFTLLFFSPLKQFNAAGARFTATGGSAPAQTGAIK
jgi:hypothetical protein